MLYNKEQKEIDLNPLLGLLFFIAALSIGTCIGVKFLAPLILAWL